MDMVSLCGTACSCCNFPLFTFATCTAHLSVPRLMLRSFVQCLISLGYSFLLLELKNLMLSMNTSCVALSFIGLLSVLSCKGLSLTMAYLTRKAFLLTYLLMPIAQ